MSGIVAVALLQAAGLPSSAAPPPASASTAEASAPERLREEDLLLFSLELDRLTLTDTLTAYGDPADPLLPVGELARLLDLDLTVAPPERRVTGTLGEERRSVTIDLNAPIARVAGRNVAFASDDVGFTHSDLYIRAKVLERILPIRIEVDQEGLAIKLTALEKLPIQARMERLGRTPEPGQDLADNEPAMQVDSPYLFLAPPSFDVALESGRDTRVPGFSRRYDVRFAGDLLYSSFQGYFGSDENGSPSTARMLFERRSAAGNLLGPLGATRLSAGDVFTPGLAMGPRSAGGRGISFSTVPLEQVSVFNTIDLRGELPIGSDAELYINDILRSGQRTPVQGRYEFLNVPLVRGLNVIRVVIYGARGERSEVVRVVNVGGGQLRKNETHFEFGLVQQDKAVIDPRPLAERELITATVGAPRLAASVSHGLSEAITVVGGAALYTSLQDDARNMLSAGIRTSLSGIAVQLDAAGDHKGGMALALGLAGQPLGVSTILRHSEYRGGFLDETGAPGDFLRPPSRKTAATMDLGIPSFGGKVIPLSLRLVRDGYADGGVAWLASSRASTTIEEAFVSAGLDYSRETSSGVDLRHRLTGNLSASKFVDFKWQLRGSLDYELLPAARLMSVALSADRAVSDNLALRFGLGQTLTKPRDTFLQAGGVLRLPIGDLALTGDFAARTGDWKIGVRFAFGSLFDPRRRSYVLTPPGPASGGNAVFHSFIDRDGDGRFGAGDEAAPGVRVEGGEKPLTTDKSGRAVLTGLGTSPTGRIQANIQDVESLYVSSPPSAVKFAPRPGKVLYIPYALAPVGEVYAKLLLRQPEGLKGLSAVSLRLLREGADPILAITEYDGSVVFSEVPLGTYRLEIDPAQAQRLKMRLKEPVSVTVTADQSSDVDAEVVFDQVAS